MLALMQRSVLMVLWFCWPPQLALADAISGPPEDCSRGAFGVSSHSGAWCASTTCATVADCAPYADTPRGRIALGCEPLGLCVVSETYTEGGMRPADVAPAVLVREVASGLCTSDADCAAPSRCIVAPRCVALPGPVSDALARACGCRASAPQRGERPALFFFGLAALVVARRASRARTKLGTGLRS